MPSLNIAIGPLLRVLEQLVAERSAMDKLLGQAVHMDAVCVPLMTIPGVGPITNLAFNPNDVPVSEAGRAEPGTRWLELGLLFQ